MRDRDWWSAVWISRLQRPGPQRGPVEEDGEVRLVRVATGDRLQPPPEAMPPAAPAFHRERPVL